jgi:hypothetical protein
MGAQTRIPSGPAFRIGAHADAPGSVNSDATRTHLRGQLGRKPRGHAGLMRRPCLKCGVLIPRGATASTTARPCAVARPPGPPAPRHLRQPHGTQGLSLAPRSPPICAPTVRHGVQRISSALAYLIAISAWLKRLSLAMTETLARLASWRICLLAAALVVSGLLGGCGSGREQPPKRRQEGGNVAQALVSRISAWSSATTSYNYILQNCRQPYPTHGYVASCTREWRVNYKRDTARLLRALPTAQSSGACGHALAQARSLTTETTTALRQAFGAYSALLDNRPYHGPAVFLLLKRADKTTKRDTKLADRLSSDVRQSCPG